MSDLTLSPVLTSAGLAAVAAAHGQGLQVKITQVAVGDGGFEVRDENGYPLPDALAKTGLDAEQVRVDVYAGAVTGPQQVVVEARIDAGDPNFWVKEVGFFLEDGTLFAVWSSATLNLGWRGDLVPWVFRFMLSWTQLPEDAVTVEFNGDAAYADLLGQFLAHLTDPSAHPLLNTYDMPFNAGWGGDGSGEDLEVGGVGALLLRRDVQVLEVQGRLMAPATGGDVEIDVLINGTSLFTEDRPKFLDGETNLTGGTFFTNGFVNNALWSAGDVAEVKVLSVGPTTAGQKMLITIVAKVR